MNISQFEDLMDEAADLEMLASMVNECQPEQAENLRLEAEEIRLEAEVFLEEIK